ncbi:MAG: hypothetical protein ACKVT1_02910 [Dehalococcoidia bacterium]
MNTAMTNPVTPWILAGRIISILGMGFCAAAGILLAIVPSIWALVCAAAFVPFFVLIVAVEKFSSRHGLIGPEVAASDDD